jgi:hypothetical protein
MARIKGIEIADLTVGTGAEATSESVVLVSVRMFLRRGDEVVPSPGFGPKILIDLGRRDAIAGLRYAIPGMRVGGIRKILISPHLAYGAFGIPDKVPPNALLRCEVELLEIREREVLLPQDAPPGKLLLVTSGGGAVRGLPWWQFSASEGGRCGVSIVRPIVGLRWRNTPRKNLEISLAPDEISVLIENALHLPKALLEVCVPPEKLWSGKTDQGYPFTFGGDDKKPCVTLNVYEMRQTLCNYSIQEDCVALHDSDFFQAVSRLIRPHLSANPI